MKIGFTSHSTDLTGAERSLLGLLRLAAERDHEVHVWVPGTGPLAARLADMRGEGVTLHRRPNHWWMSRRGHGVVGAVRLAQAAVDAVGFARDLRRLRPDVLVVNTSVTPAPLLAATVLGVPAVTIVRESVRTNPTLRSVLPKTVIVAALARWSTQVVAISRYVAEQLQPWPAGVPAPVVRPSGVTMAPVPPQPRPSDSASLRLLLLGSVGGDKGQLDAVHAAAAAIRSGADLRLDMYGTGVPEELAKVRAAIEGSGLGDRLHLHEPVGDITLLLAQADVLVMTSRNEAYGRVTVEALQAGVPVIGYRAGATSEILEEGGGLLVPADVTALEHALRAVANDPGLVPRLTTEAVEAGNRLRRIPRDAETLAVIEAVVDARRPPSPRAAARA